MPILWWGIPVGALAYVVWRHRPAAWSWPLIFAAFAMPLTPDPFLTGNPTMWLMAAVAAGTLWVWPAVAVLLKPTFAPFLLVAVRDLRASALALSALAAVSFLMLPEWFRYIDVLRNMSSPGLTYSFLNYPLLVVLIIAWAARRERSATPTTPTAGS